jgi:hypothetical protein
MFELLGKGIWAIALRLAIGAAASLAGIAGMNALWPSAPPPAQEAKVDASRSTRILLAIDLAVLAAKDYVKGEEPTVAGREFDEGIRRIQELVTRLEREDEAARTTARAVESELLRIETIVRSAQASDGARRAAEIAQRRDRIASVMTELHASDLRRVDTTSDPATSMTFKLGGAGLATLGLCFAGGVGLAKMCVV